MALVNIDTDKAAIDAVDEATKTLLPAFEIVLNSLIDKLLEGIKGSLIGRTITITIKQER